MSPSASVVASGSVVAGHPRCAPLGNWRWSCFGDGLVPVCRRRLLPVRWLDASVMSVLVESRSGRYLENEDRYLAVPEVPFYAVLDGEGHNGHAADVALTVLRAGLASLTAALPSGPERARDVLVETVRQANQAVFADATTRWRGCGTTLTCLVLTAEVLVVAHVGDSRLYCRHSSGWHCVTVDHSLVADARRTASGQELSELIANHANVITRALGFATEIEVDTIVVPRVAVSDAFLCTDGLWRPFDPLLAGAAPPNLTGQELVDWTFQAYDSHGQLDNATGLLVSVQV